MSIQDIIYAKIKEEITTDPQGVGYAGKSDDEIMTLLNEPIRKQISVEKITQAPLSRILSGIGGTKNVVDKNDVVGAKAAVLSNASDVII